MTLYGDLSAFFSVEECEECSVTSMNGHRICCSVYSQLTPVIVRGTMGCQEREGEREREREREKEGGGRGGGGERERERERLGMYTDLSDSHYARQPNWSEWYHVTYFWSYFSYLISYYLL